MVLKTQLILSVADMQVLPASLSAVQNANHQHPVSCTSFPVVSQCRKVPMFRAQGPHAFNAPRPVRDTKYVRPFPSAVSSRLYATTLVRRKVGRRTRTSSDTIPTRHAEGEAQSTEFAQNTRRVWKSNPRFSPWAPSILPGPLNPSSTIRQSCILHT